MSASVLKGAHASIGCARSRPARASVHARGLVASRGAAPALDLASSKMTATREVAAAAGAVAEPVAAPGGHTALLQGLGDLGDVPPHHMPALLRLAHIMAHYGGDSQKAQAKAARGLMVWKAAMDRGLMPDDTTIAQLAAEPDHWMSSYTEEELQWPEQPLRDVLCQGLSKLGLAHFAHKYPKVQDAMLGTLLQVVCKYHKVLLGLKDEEQQRMRDEHGNVFMTAAEHNAKLEADRARREGREVPDAAAKAAAQAAAEAEAAEEEEAAYGTVLSEEMKLSRKLMAAVLSQWEAPIQTLRSAGKAFGSLEALLGGAAFELKGGLWKRKGWAQMDELRAKLEELKELRDLVRSLGRSAGWGPLRRAPVQHLDMAGRPGLLRTPLEAQETRGLTRSDDISRLLPSEMALMANGKKERMSKLLFFSKMVEKSLACYERDGWGEFPTVTNPERREIRPTADMGPILLCVDTSGSMRGPRATVAKALALECMRAAKEQERDCYVFAFSGPQEVKELELNYDMASVRNLLDFLESTFNGGSDFNEPVRRCMDRLTDAKWQNSDILLVSDGELRQPKPEVMRKLSGAKAGLGLRVHGLVVGEPTEQRADPAVLRALCTNPLPDGSVEVLVTRFENWAGVQADSSLQFDWDDAEGNAARRLAGLKHEAHRAAEVKRRRKEQRVIAERQGGSIKINNKIKRMPGKMETFQ